MDLKPISDFFTSIKDKITNPFFGTLIIVLLTRNWELVYTIFNFDKTATLRFKVQIIKNFIQQKEFTAEIISTILNTLFVMVIGYIIIVGTRSLSIYIEHNVMPSITKKIINKNTVSKEEYNKLSNELDEYFNKYETERNRVRQFSKDYEAQLGLFAELNKKHEDLKSNYILSSSNELKLELDNKNLITKITHLERTNDNISSELDHNKFCLKQALEIFEENQTRITEILLNSDIIKNIIKELESLNYTNDFISTMRFYKQGGTTNLTTIKVLSNLGLVSNEGGKNEKPSLLAYLIAKYILNKETLENGKFNDYKKQMKLK